MATDYATEGSTGASFTRVTEAPEFQTGLRQRGTNARDYIYVRANGEIAAAASAKVAQSGDVWLATSGAGQHTADVAMPDGQYGWVRQRFSLPDEADEVDFDDTGTGWGVADLQAAIEYINDNFSVSTHTHGLDELSDVSAGAPSTHDVIAWDGAAWANTQRVRDLAQLGDVDLTGLTSNQVLVWDGSGWVPEDENAHMHTLSDIADAGVLAGLDSISNGNWSGTDLAVANGGTGASTEAGARSNLGLAIGSDVQGWDAVLDSLGANADLTGTLEKTGADTLGTYAVTAYGKSILDDATAGAVRTTLELGALAVEDSVGSSLIDNNAVTNVELTDMGAATIKGRQAGSGTGNPQDLAAAQVVAILQTADGSGSGLDADLLDGNEASAFATAAATVTDERLVRGDGGDKGVQGSTVALNDAGDLSGIRHLSMSGNATVGGTLSIGATFKQSGAGFQFGQVESTDNGASWEVVGAAGTPRQFKFKTGATPRWTLACSATAESGSDAGSDFVLSSFADAGTFIADVARWRRSDGAMQLGSPTGGYKGAGTLNAVSVYDDNALLTHGPVAIAKAGALDLDAFDAMVPDLVQEMRVHLEPVMEEVEIEAVEIDLPSAQAGRFGATPVGRVVRKRVWRERVVQVPVLDEEEAPVMMRDAEGREIGPATVPVVEMREVTTPAKTTPRVHTAARRLQRLVAEGLDVTDPRSVVDYLMERETLPCMPTREEWGDGSQMSLGTLRNCDSMAVEILGLCVRNLLERLEALEGGVPAR